MTSCCQAETTTSPAWNLGGCLHASSTPILGMLYPYPGQNNTFVPPAFVGGGERNRALAYGATVAGGRYNAATAPYATIGGGTRNTASGKNSTVAGGGRTVLFGNIATKDYSTVGGGRGNLALALDATVAGGKDNTARGHRSTVGGGEENTADGEWASVPGGRMNIAAGRLATVGGGSNNDASGDLATVCGGSLNTASGAFATAAAGRDNTALGDHSFAAGRLANANHAGAFVWGDSVNTNKTSSAADEFNVYASGGVRMFTNSAATTGVLLAAGGSTWTTVSDRDAKENIEPVDAQAVLDKVAVLPLATWNYKEQDDSIRHMGPMAQDFYAAFGLGLGEKTIDTIDPNGVALAAIQGLHELVREKDAEIEENEVQIGELRAANEALLARVEQLEELAQATMAK